MKIEITISKTIYYMALVMLMTLSISAQVKQEWAKGYNGTGNGDDLIRAMAADRNGNVYVTGSASSNGKGLDFVTKKYSSDGTELWSATYDFPNNNGDDIPYGICVNSSTGDVFVTGSSETSNSMIWRTVKYNKDGLQQWFAVYQNWGNSRPSAISLDINNDVIVTGSTTSQTSMDFATIKYNRDTGQQQWVSTYDGTGGGTDFASALTTYYDFTAVTGSSMGTGGVMDYLTILYDRDGNEMWVNRYGGTGGGNDHATDITWNVSSGRPVITRFFVTGYSRGSGGLDDYTTIKYSFDGTQEWVKRYYDPSPNNSDSRAFAISSRYEVGDQEIAVTGQSSGDYATVVYDIDGNEKLVMRYDGVESGNDLASDVIFNGNSIYVTGRSGNDAVTIKYNTWGEQVWLQSYNGPKNSTDMGSLLALDRNNPEKVFVGGFQNGVANNSRDFLTIGYSDDRVDWANLQWPPFGVIKEGEDFIAYAQMWDAETDYQGALPYISAWIGVHNVNFPPALWPESAWISADFNEDKGRKDEYMAEIGSRLEPGTYYYASRFQKANGGYSYGGYSSSGGGFWDVNTNNSNMLVVNLTTSVDNDPLPTEYSLEQNYPNPFNPSTTIKMGLPEQGFVDLRVYNVLGEEIAQLVNRELNAGYHEFNFDASNLPSGIYIYKVQANSKFTSTQKMMLLK